MSLTYMSLISLMSVYLGIFHNRFFLIMGQSHRMWTSESFMFTKFQYLLSMHACQGANHWLSLKYFKKATTFFFFSILQELPPFVALQHKLIKTIYLLFKSQIHVYRPPFQSCFNYISTFGGFSNRIKISSHAWYVLLAAIHSSMTQNVSWFFRDRIKIHSSRSFREMLRKLH